MSDDIEDIVAMARAAQRDERLSDGPLYGKLADEITRLRADRRERIATACLASILTHDGWERASVPAMALHAIAYADALIDELDWKAKP